MLSFRFISCNALRYVILDVVVVKTIVSIVIAGRTENLSRYGFHSCGRCNNFTFQSRQSANDEELAGAHEIKCDTR